MHDRDRLVEDYDKLLQELEEARVEFDQLAAENAHLQQRLKAARAVFARQRRALEAAHVSQRKFYDGVSQVSADLEMINGRLHDLVVQLGSRIENPPVEDE